MIDRRSVLQGMAGLAAAAAAKPFPSAAAAAQAACEPAEIKVHVFAGNIFNMPADIMEGAGMFAANCLKAERVPIASAPAAFAQSVQGSVNFIHSAPDNVLIARSKGLDLKIIANVFDREYNSLVVAKGTPLPHAAQGFPALMKDLVGKKIGVTALGTSSQALAEADFVAAGLSPQSATYVALGNLQAMLAGLQNRSIDAVEMFGNGPDVAVAQGLGRIVVDPRIRGEGPKAVQELNGTTSVWVVQADYVKSHPEIVRRFIKANAEAIAWAGNAKNRDRLVKIESQYAPIPSDVPNPDRVMRHSCDLFASMMDPKVSRSALEAWNKFAMSLGTLSKPIPYDEVVWNG